MEDLFGNKIDKIPEKKKWKSEAMPEVNPMVELYGEYGLGDFKCGTCKFLYVREGIAHTDYMCELRMQVFKRTAGKTTTHKKSWTACTKYVEQPKTK